MRVRYALGDPRLSCNEWVRGPLMLDRRSWCTLERGLAMKVRVGLVLYTLRGYSRWVEG